MHFPCVKSTGIHGQCAPFADGQKHWVLICLACAFGGIGAWPTKLRTEIFLSCIVFELPQVDCPGIAESETMARIVRVESSGNPFAIGVVGGRLQRQPANLQEAVQTADQLEKAGYNYSIGLSQVNRIHFKRFGWLGDIKNGFNACVNLQAGADVLLRCKEGAARSLNSRSPDAVLRAALSCYYSGSYTAGEKMGYVDKVLSNGGKKLSSPNAPSFRSMFD